MATAAELVSAAKGEFALTEAANDPLLTDAQWLRALNRGYRWLCYRSRLISAEWTLTTVVSQREYDISALSPLLAGLTLVRMNQQGQMYRKLAPVPFDRVATDAGGFEDATGTPMAYWTRGGDKLGLYPMPDATNAGTNYIRMWGWAYPSALLTVSTPAINSALHDYLIPATCYEMAKEEQARGRDGSGMPRVQLYDLEREKALAEVQHFVQAMSAEPQYVSTAGEYW